MKETFYFSHDYNARTDSKIRDLIRKHGYEGYGLYWAIIEDLYNNANALRMDCDGIAFDLHSDKESIHSILFNFNLFVFEGDFFGSLSVQRRIDERDLKSRKARDSAFKRWNKDANALRTHCEGNAIKESIVKESIVKESIKNEEKTTAFRPDFSLCPEWMKEPMKLWLKHKSEKKQSYKETGFDQLVEKWKKDFPNGKGLFDAVRKSVSNNYAGVFPKDEPQKSETTNAFNDPAKEKYQLK